MDAWYMCVDMWTRGREWDEGLPARAEADELVPWPVGDLMGLGPESGVKKRVSGDPAQDHGIDSAGAEGGRQTPSEQYRPCSRTVYSDEIALLQLCKFDVLLSKLSSHCIALPVFPLGNIPWQFCPYYRIPSPSHQGKEKERRNVSSSPHGLIVALSPQKPRPWLALSLANVTSSRRRRTQARRLDR